MMPVVHISHIINAKNTIYLMGYISNDQFKLDGDTTYAYANRNANIKWKHNFSNSSFAVFTTGIDHYQYSVSSTKVPVNAYKLSFDINQFYLRADFNYAPNNKHAISYGLNSVYYQLTSRNAFTGSVLNHWFRPIHCVRNRLWKQRFILGDQFTVSPEILRECGHTV